MLQDLKALSEAITTALAETKAAGGKLPARSLARIVDSFDWDAWSVEMADLLDGPLRDIMNTQATRTAENLGETFDPDDPFVKRTFTEYVGARIKQLDATTKEEVSELIRSVVEESGAESTLALGDLVRDQMLEKFEEYADYRADRIARTETANLYNVGTILASRQMGFTHVEVFDGDEDEECSAANGQIWTLAQALANPTAHPNCERSFAPVDADEE
jgi:hypothetical protein